MEDATPEATPDASAAFAERLFLQLLGGMETLAVYVGDRLGQYRALADSPLTVDELSAHTGMHPRYAREWLEQQAVSSVLTVDESGAQRRFALPAAHAEVLSNPHSLTYTPPLARMMLA